jgi:hypothetical protein
VIREWPGQTKEEWLAEYHRNKNLTPKEREKEMEDFLAEVNKQDEEMTQINTPPTPQTPENFFENCDHPNSLDNVEATIVWIVVMVIGAIFKGNWIIWIIATIIWLKYITRHKIKK